MDNMILLFSGMMFFFFIWLFEKYLWSSTQEKFCHDNCGHCELCNCWSCTRKSYIDEYKNYKTKKYINFEKEI